MMQGSFSRKKRKGGQRPQRNRNSRRITNHKS